MSFRRYVCTFDARRRVGGPRHVCRRGQYALREGRIDESIDSFRRATVKNRVDQRYVLALAHGLELKGDTEGARAVLLALRESAPEDPDINLQLARLAAARSDVTE